MNFRELTREEAAIYEKIKAREAMVNGLIRALTVIAASITAANIITLFW